MPTEILSWSNDLSLQPVSIAGSILYRATFAPLSRRALLSGDSVRASSGAGGDQSSRLLVKQGISSAQDGGTGGSGQAPKTETP